MTSHFVHFAPIPPSARGNGLAMRTSMFTEALARLGRVTVVVLGGDSPGQDALQGDRVVLQHVPSCGWGDTRLRLISMIADPVVRAAALRSYGRPFASAFLSAPVLADAAARFRSLPCAGVMISRAYLLPLLQVLPPTIGRPPVIVDLDDDDGALCREWAALSRARGDRDAADWQEMEAEGFDALVSASRAEVALMTCASDAVRSSISSRLELERVRTILNGVEFPSPGPAAVRSRTLIFVGNLSYGPNVDGLLWFAAEIWPILRAEAPRVRLLVAGSRPTEEVRRACGAPGITLHADPPELAPYYRDAAFAVVPLRSGSGSRIKILEAAAHGVPVVSTGKGAEGLGADIRDEIVDGGERTETFAGACLYCLRETQSARRRADRLRRLVRTQHERNAIVAAIAALFRTVL